MEIPRALLAAIQGVALQSGLHVVRIPRVLVPASVLGLLLSEILLLFGCYIASAYLFP